MQRQLIENVKHGLAAGAGARPNAPTGPSTRAGSATPPQEHAVWKTLFERQTKLLPGRACDEFVAGHAARCRSAPSRSPTSAACPTC